MSIIRKHPAFRFIALAALAICCAASLAQETEDQCAPDEIDTGDYCVKIAEPEDSGGIGRKATPFRKQGMMPGRVENRKPKSAKSRPAVVVTDAIPAPVTAQGGFGIQLGVWSKRSTAESVCHRVAGPGRSVIMSPVTRAEQTLWACLAGPFPTRESARTELAAFREQPEFADAWVKALAGMLIEGITDD